MMETAVILAWWIILLVALALTAVLLAVIVRVIFALREIDRLAKMALPAAVGIVENTTTIAALDDVLAQAARLLNAVQAIGGVAAGIHKNVAVVGATLSGEGAK